MPGMRDVECTRGPKTKNKLKEQQKFYMHGQ